jgi:hypothetical protein
MGTLLVFAVFVVLFYGILAREADDSTEINPAECGLSFKQANRLSDKTRRFTSGFVADQREFGWHVLVLEKSFYRSGSLVNSQWVLSEAFAHEYTQNLQE